MERLRVWGNRGLLVEKSVTHHVAEQRPLSRSFGERWRCHDGYLAGQYGSDVPTTAADPSGCFAVFAVPLVQRLECRWRQMDTHQKIGPHGKKMVSGRFPACLTNGARLR